MVHIINRYRVHQANFYYFDNIDSEDKAYFLGYIFADGYVNDAGLYLTLHAQDLHILQTFCKYLENDGDLITDVKGYKRLTLTNTHLTNALHQQGAVQKKTKVLIPPNLHQDLIPHFIRGYFDGDGSIWLDKQAHSYRVQFVGTEPMMNFIQDFFETHLKLRVATKDGLIWRYGFSGNQQIAEKLDKIYHNASPDLYLIRKYQKYQDCVNLAEYRNQHRNEIWTNNLGAYARKGISEVCEPTDHRV